MSISVSRGMPNVACTLLHFAYNENLWRSRQCNQVERTVVTADEPLARPVIIPSVFLTLGRTDSKQNTLAPR